MRQRTSSWTALCLGFVIGCSASESSDASSPAMTSVSAGSAASAPATPAAASTAADSSHNIDFRAMFSQGPSTPTTTVPPKVVRGAPASMDKFSAVGSNPFVLTARDPYSTFAADVDTASYDVFRRNMERSVALDKSSVRVEEFVNYFEYDYPAPDPKAEHPFTIDTALAQNPLGRDTLLLRVGIQASKPQPEQRKQANLVFLIDTSGSMRQEDKLPLVQYLLTHTLDVLRPTDKVSIVTYASGTAVRLGPTPVTEKDKISEVVNGLSADGSTNGAGGIQLAYEQAQAAFLDDGINHVILCTDGDFNVGTSSTDELVAMIKDKRKTGITLTALGFGLGNLNDAMMEKVSNAGNGMYSVITSKTQASRYAEDRMLRTFLHVAKDMKLQLEWNPKHVYAYRLIGYEDRAIADQDFRDDMVDAGEVGAGHRVTALYEVVPQGKKIPQVDGAPETKEGEAVPGEREVKPEDMVLVKVRYKQPGASAEDAAREVVSRLPADAKAKGFDDASQDLRYAVAIAAFAEILKASPYAAPSDKLDALRKVFEAQAGRDGERKEFLSLFDTARSKNFLPTP